MVNGSHFHCVLSPKTELNRLHSVRQLRPRGQKTRLGCTGDPAHPASSPGPRLTLLCRLLSSSESTDHGSVIGPSLWTLPGGNSPSRNCHDLHDRLVEALAEADQGRPALTHATQHDACGVTQRVTGVPGHRAAMLIAKRGQMDTECRVLLARTHGENAPWGQPSDNTTMSPF